MASGTLWPKTRRRIEKYPVWSYNDGLDNEGEPMPWDDEVADMICDTFAIGEEFTADQIYTHETYFQRLHPRNHFVQDKLRQVLQHLRDQGMIHFIDDRGNYCRVK